jgi:catechol 2,3-dioxygenase-like lactoylglutathione lyase family enzyme
MRNKRTVSKEALAPVLQISNAEAAIAWYHRLGFVLEFEHSSGPDLKRTMAFLKRGDLPLILSDRGETGGSSGIVYLRVADVTPIATEFNALIQKSAIGPHIELTDPDGNVIRVVTDPMTRFTERRGRYV